MNSFAEFLELINIAVLYLNPGCFFSSSKESATEVSTSVATLIFLIPQRIAQLQHGWLRGSRQNIFWPIAVMIQTRSFFRRWNKTWFLSFPQRKIGNSYVNTTNISTKFDISLRMLSCSSKDGAILRRATLKILLLSSPPSKSVVLPFGCSFIDDTI